MDLYQHLLPGMGAAAAQAVQERWARRFPPNLEGSGTRVGSTASSTICSVKPRSRFALGLLAYFALMAGAFVLMAHTLGVRLGTTTYHSGPGQPYQTVKEMEKALNAETYRLWVVILLMGVVAWLVILIPTLLRDRRQWKVTRLVLFPIVGPLGFGPLAVCYLANGSTLHRGPNSPRVAPTTTDGSSTTVPTSN